jgi:5-methylcytosine-specific restriction endonuclease McrA
MDRNSNSEPEFRLEPYHRNVSDDALLGDLRRVADVLSKPTVTAEEYDEHGNYNSCTLRRRFGGWLKALSNAGLKKTRNLGVTRDDYFENLEKVWRHLGRQPRYSEMRKPVSNYCSGAYEDEFGTWRKALAAFVEFTERGDVFENQGSHSDNQHEPPVVDEIRHGTHKTPRQPNYRLRFKVMRRDKFKCVLCGRTPATTLDITLVIDHKQPWDAGGATTYENLQTLCDVCNSGKSNLAPNDPN